MTEQIGFFDRIKRGWTIAMTGWQFIRNNPSCLIFPLISSITKAAFFLFALVLYAFYAVAQGALLAEESTHLAHNHVEKSMSVKLTMPATSKIIIGFIFLFMCILITSIMYTALSFYLAKKIEGQPVSIASSIGRGFARFKTLLVWSLISAALTMIFDMIRNSAKDGKFPFNLIAQLVAGLLQFAWNVLTFFIYPIFALKDLSAIASIEESGNTMKKMWGQSIGATFNISFIGFIGFIALTAPVSLIARLILSKEGFILVCFASILVAIILINLWIQTAKTLFQTAAYLHTQGKQTGPFDTNFIKASFSNKS